MRSILTGLLVVISLAPACAPSVAARMARSDPHDCPKLLADSVALRAEPAFQALPPYERGEYEVKLAGCLLEARKPEEAGAIAQSWPESRSERDEVLARAATALGHDDEARAALGRLSRQTRVNLEPFLDAPELQRLHGEDWYVATAVNAWSRARSVDLEPFVARLASREGTAKLLRLEVAAADAARPAGDWAAWTGIVRQAKLDRANDRTVLLAEGVDGKTTLVGIDRKVEFIKTQALVYGSRSLSSAYAESKPTYSTDRYYEDTFTPNGRLFAVWVRGASEQLTAVRYFTAVGHYSGRSDDARPLVAAVAVVERMARSTTTHDKE